MCDDMFDPRRVYTRNVTKQERALAAAMNTLAAALEHIAVLEDEVSELRGRPVGESPLMKRLEELEERVTNMSAFVSDAWRDKHFPPTNVRPPQSLAVMCPRCRQAFYSNRIGELCNACSEAAP